MIETRKTLSWRQQEGTAPLWIKDVKKITDEEYKLYSWGFLSLGIAKDSI